MMESETSSDEQWGSSKQAPVAESEIQNLRATAKLLGHLLLHELDRDLVLELQGSGARSILAEMGLQIPAPDDQKAFDALAVEYFERFVNPEDGAPPIQSLAQEGKYMGLAVKGVEEIAKAAALSFQSESVQGAPVDHLGAELAMWAELIIRDPNAAQEFASRHLAWAIPYLGTQEPHGFYGQLSILVCQFIKSISAPYPE